MKRRFLKDTEANEQSSSLKGRSQLRSLQDNLERFGGRKRRSSTLRTLEDVAQPLEQSTCNPDSTVTIGGRVPLQLDVRKLTNLPNFCEHMSETLFTKGSKITNKQQLKKIALQYFATTATTRETDARSIRIAILNVACNGYSDVVFGHKIFSYMGKWYPKSVIHLLTTNLKAYEELGLDTVPEFQPVETATARRRQTSEPQQRILQLNVKSEYEAEVEKNLEHECQFRLSHLMLDTRIPYDLILVAPIVHPGDATIGKIRKLFPYSTYMNTYFVSDYNMSGYDKAVTNVDFPTGIGRGTLGLLFDKVDESEQSAQNQLSPDLRRKLRVNYGIASMGVEKPIELGCFRRFVLSFLRQYPNEKVIDIVISPDIVRALTASKSIKEYDVVFQQMFVWISESTNYNAVTLITNETQETRPVRETPERDRRYRSEKEQRFYEGEDIGEDFETSSQASSEASSFSSRDSRGFARSRAEWFAEVTRASQPGGQQLFVNEQAVQQLRPVQLLRLRGDIFPVQYRDMSSLYANALKPVLINGDQTVTDLLTCCMRPGEIFLYQIRPWKRTFARRLAQDLHFPKIESASDNCSEVQGSIVAAGRLPTLATVKRFCAKNNFETLAKPLIDSIVSMIADNKVDSTSVWNTYVTLVNGRYVVKDIKKYLKEICTKYANL